MSYWDYFFDVLIVAAWVVAVVAWVASILWTFLTTIADYHVWWAWRILAGLYAFFAVVAGLALLAKLTTS